MLIKNILLTQGDCAIDNSHLPKINYTQFYKEDAYEQSRKHTCINPFVQNDNFADFSFFIKL